MLEKKTEAIGFKNTASIMDLNALGLSAPTEIFTNKLEKMKAEALYYTRSLKYLPDSITRRPQFAKHNKVYLDFA